MEQFEGQDQFNEFNEMQNQVVTEKDELIKSIYTVNELLESNKYGLIESDYQTLLVFTTNYNDIREKFQMLINRYIEDPVVLQKLIDANDLCERVQKKYLQQQQQGKIVILTSQQIEQYQKEQQVISNENQIKWQQLDDPWESFEEFECPICFDDIEKAEEGKKLSPCGHKYCRECVRDYLETLIKNGEVSEIKCPESNCQHELGYDDIRKLIPPKSFAKYEEFTLRAALNSDPNVRWCPNPKSCGNAIINEDPSNSKMVCGVCKYEFCFNCNEEYHIGTCEDYENWKIENGKADKNFSKWSKENTKPCPNCKANIQKNNGCNHMTCYKCKYEFCWLCLRKYTSNHFDVYNVLGCPGLQTGKAENFGVIRRTGVRVGIVAGAVVAAPIVIALAVPVAVIGGPIYGIYRWRKWARNRRYIRRRNRRRNY